MEHLILNQNPVVIKEEFIRKPKHGVSSRNGFNHSAHDANVYHLRIGLTEFTNRALTTLVQVALPALSMKKNCCSKIALPASAMKENCCSKVCRAHWMVLPLNPGLAVSRLITPTPIKEI